jgi:RNA polymerase sigma factor (sigma-70 family)
MMDVAALDRLLAEHAAALTLFARQWCAAPEDAVQEAFLKLVSLRPEPRSPVGWLYRAVRNGAISAGRAERRRQRHEGRAAARAPAWFHPAEPTGLDAATAAAALADLPVEQREVIVARLWGGLTFEQIAELTGTSPPTAFRRYAAGLEALRQKLRVSCPAKKTPS